MKEVVTTQRTSKIWKLLLIVFAAACFWGVYDMCVGATNPAFVDSMENMREHESITRFLVGFAKVMFGSFSFSFVRLCIWWFHA